MLVWTEGKGFDVVGLWNELSNQWPFCIDNGVLHAYVPRH